MIIHDFQSSLKASHTAEDNPVWEHVYRKFFPNFGTMHSCRDDGEHQRNGIDRVIVLGNGKSVAIDEKVRFKAYNDIALEYWSSYESKKPGWVCKPLMCDYIAYLIAPNGRCYLLPTQQLQAAWLKHSEDWLKTHRTIKAYNPSYTTHCLIIPVQVLFKAIGDCLRCQFNTRHYGFKQAPS